MKRYLWLFVAAVAAAGIAGFAARHLRAAAPTASIAAAPSLRLTVRITARDVATSTAAIPAGTRVALEVTNASGAPARLRLAGYEDRVDTGTLAPGGATAIGFLADRPGDRFSWLVGDEPRGRLDVTGSHLVEGHQ